MTLASFTLGFVVGASCLALLYGFLDDWAKQTNTCRRLEIEISRFRKR